MRRRSKDTAALYREWTPVRSHWLADGPCCTCGGTPDDVHEIIAGGNRRVAFVEICCWLRTCRLCHKELQNMPKALQLAYKLLSDPENYDRERVLELWRRADTAVTAAEVLSCVRQILLWRQAA